MKCMKIDIEKHNKKHYPLTYIVRGRGAYLGFLKGTL